ncbi:MAG: M4 family metallopeptidase [Dyadobacter sp.]|uniref:M4 family metallopeptidase n=1 Tax=Dyadobacter sp. TaxID=1914288 RepID=UPI003263E9E7
MKQNYLRAICLLIFYFGIWIIPDANAQTFYTPLQYGQPLPFDVGKLGILYNHEPYLMTNVKTTYHGKQNVYATAYLPFVASEYEFFQTVKTFGPHYTTGVALCSPKNPALGLYAPVEIISSDADDNLYALAGVVPYDNNQADYKGPFNTFKTLNVQNNGVVNPSSDEDAISALDAAQKFPKFTYDLFKDANGVGWAGFDKAGTIPIVCRLINEVDLNGYASNMINIRKTSTFDTYVTRQTIGHEISHGILHHAISTQTDLFAQTMSELNEGLADILGYSFSLWMEPAKFENPTWFKDWELYPDITGDKFMTFYNQKDYELPIAYKGDFYIEDPLDKKYDVHHNGEPLKYAVFAMNEGASGYVDGKSTNDFFQVFPLIPGDKDGTFKLALQILFKAFTEKLSATATYPDLRVASLEAATELGHGPGSHAYLQLMAAWDLINVKETLHNVNCTTATAQSLINGALTINIRERTLLPGPASQKISELIDCSNPNNIRTMFRTGFNRSIFTDWDNDLNFSKNNNEDESKLAVTVHGFTQVTRDWYKKTLGYDGLKGGEPVLIKNEIWDFPYPDVKFDIANVATVFQYPNQKKFICRDQISKSYFRAIDLYAKYDQIQFQSITKEWNTIVRSMGEILSLATKRDYEKDHQNPNADNIWTLFEELSDPTLLRDFSNPKLYGQPALYQGALWDANNYVNNTGFINLCYYLLVHGTVNDATSLDEGYTNDEPGSLTYFINKMDKDVVVNAFFQGYLATPANSGIEEFRLATMKALHDQGYGLKSKEHIAFYDAWAAVLGFPDYASTLKHYPEDNAVIHPWMPIDEMSGMFGVEVEYITYESSRLFEVSKSATFNANEAPVYQFLNKTAPDMVTGMTFADVHLEPGQTYYVHSRLSNTGDPHQGCAATPDPAFCESLKGKQKWTVTYKVHTQEVTPVDIQNPKAGETIAAWGSPFSWMSKAGADGYDLHITEKSGNVPEQTMPFDKYYNEDDAQVPLETFLALSKTSQYSWSVVARRKLGSFWAVHVWPNGMTYPLTDEEKAAFPDAYGSLGAVTDFKTDLPTLTPGAYPADGEHVPLIGAPFILTSSSLSNAGNNYNFEYKEPYKQFINTGQPAFSMHVSNIPGIVDKQAVQWAFTPVKAATPPFILAEEKGATVWRTFIADLSLSPAPVLKDEQCAFQSGVVLQWGQVADAQGYKYSVKEAGTNVEVASGTTDKLVTPVITTASSFPTPGKYTWSVAAGIKNSNNVWLYGPEGSDVYGVNPPAPISLIPDNSNSTVTLGDNHSATFTWENGPSTHISNTHLFTLLQEVGGVMEVVQGLAQIPVTGNQLVVNDLDFNSSYQWLVFNSSDLSACHSDPSKGSFKTGDNPIKPELGFTLHVSDPIDYGADGILYYDDFMYTVKVRRPDGQVLDFGSFYCNSGEINFAPGNSFQPGIPYEVGNSTISQMGVGQIPEMEGDWEIRLKIIQVWAATSASDNIAAQPTVEVEVKEYFPGNAPNTWILNQSIPTPSNPVFQGRVLGKEVNLNFHYELP